MMEMGTKNQKVRYFFSAVFFFCLYLPKYCTAKYNISSAQTITDGETLVSNGEVFELGFFSPGNSSNRYIGIWHKRIPVQKVVWVANREKPLSDSSGILKIGGDGNLVLLDGTENVVWSTNVSGSSNSSLALLLDEGNLVLTGSTSEESDYIWQSFDYPTDTQFQTMRIGVNTRTGEEHVLTSWKSENDPSPGNFIVGVGRLQLPQILIWNGSVPYWRSGEWNGTQFLGMPNMQSSYVNGTRYISDGGVYFTYSIFQNGDISIRTIEFSGTLKEMLWYKGNTGWTERSKSNSSPPRDQCDIYDMCGPFGSCNINKPPNICRCLQGFEPKFIEEWNKGNWSGGCLRRAQLLCEKNKTSEDVGKEDGFLRLEGKKLPDYSNFMIFNAEQCRDECFKNCSCLAYATVPGIGCLVWGGNLLDIRDFQVGGHELFLRVAHSELGKRKPLKAYIVILIVGSIISVVLACVLCIYKLKQRGKIIDVRDTSPPDLLIDDETKGDKLELPSLDFDTVAVATNGFSDKLGEGGFGPVYKGKLPDGREIAVKRLSTSSGQGLQEFKNELKLISKLQHRNLVRLLGFCVDNDEKILLYEYMPHKSLDAFLFDPTRRSQLDWAKRFNIIDGIARGLLYLHRDSRLKVIHRDLKASNILLDEDMNSKISDFGMARIFGGKQTLANTNRVVGTYGYMSPEYAMDGIFSEKSDVFSFGVLILEIVSSKRNNGYTLVELSTNLLGHAWRLWNEDNVFELVDPTLVESCVPQEMIRCIHLGLLCVQEHAVDRPNMSTVVSMLTSDATLPTPKQPAFTLQRKHEDSDIPSHSSDGISMNALTVTIVEGR